MTALDTPVPARTLRAARGEAERAAQLFVRSVRRARWLTAAGAATGLTAGVAGMLVGSAWLLVGLPLLVLSLAVAWTPTDARRRPTRAAPGVALDPLTEPALHEHLAGLARELGVPGPSEVRLVPEAHIGIDLCTQRPVLRLGAPLLWHLDLAELDRLAAGPLAQLHAVVAPEVRPGLAVATRLDSARLADDTTPLAGALVRRLGRRLDARQRSLLAAVREWAEAAVPPTPADAGRRRPTGPSTAPCARWTRSKRSAGRPRPTPEWDCVRSPPAPWRPSPAASRWVPWRLARTMRSSARRCPC